MFWKKLDIKIFPQKKPRHWLDCIWSHKGRIRHIPVRCALGHLQNASGNVALSRWWNIIHIDGITCSNSWYCRWNFRLSSWNCRLRRYCRSCLAVRLATCISSKAWSAYSLSIAVAILLAAFHSLATFGLFSGLQHLPIGAAISHPRLVSLGPLLPVRPVWKGGKEKFLPGEYKQRKTPENKQTSPKKTRENPWKVSWKQFWKNLKLLLIIMPRYTRRIGASAFPQILHLPALLAFTTAEVCQVRLIFLFLRLGRRRRKVVHHLRFAPWVRWITSTSGTTWATRSSCNRGCHLTARVECKNWTYTPTKVAKRLRHTQTVKWNNRTHMQTCRKKNIPHNIFKTNWSKNTPETIQETSSWKKKSSKSSPPPKEKQKHLLI